jgi:hypothetical protein
MTSSVGLLPSREPPPVTPSSCMIRMSWIFSSGLTEAATIPSTCSSILRLKSEWRASSVRMFSASLMSFAASASTAARTCAASAISRASAAAFSAISTSMDFLRFRDLGLAHGLDLLLGRGRMGAGGIRLGARGAFLERLLVERDGLLHLRRLHRLLAVHLQFAADPLVVDPDLVESPFRRDPGTFHILAALDLGLAERLHPRDLQLLD